MREIGEKGIFLAGGECEGIRVEGLIHRSVVLDRGVGKTGDELIDKAYSLRWTKRISGTIAIILAQCLVVIILAPFITSEKFTKGGYHSGWGSHSVERTEIHYVDGFSR